MFEHWVTTAKFQSHLHSAKNFNFEQFLDAFYDLEKKDWAGEMQQGVQDPDQFLALKKDRAGAICDKGGVAPFWPPDASVEGLSWS